MKKHIAGQLTRFDHMRGSVAANGGVISNLNRTL
jgi:hypothetical protein